MDSGNLFFKKELITQLSDPTVAILAAEGIAKSYTQMRYQAVAVSSSDLSGGLHLFKQESQTELPWISANIFDDNNELVFPPSKLINVGKLKIGIIGISDQPSKDIAGFKIVHYQNVLQQQIEELEDECDLLLILTSLSQQVAEEIARKFHQVDLIISADKRRGNSPPDLHNHALITQTGGRGKYLGKLDIFWNKGETWITPNTRSPAKLKNRLTSTTRQIEYITKRFQQTEQHDQGLVRRLQRLKKEQIRLGDQLSQLQTELEKDRGVIKNRFVSSFLPISPRHTPEKIENIVQEINKKTTSYNKARKAGIGTKETRVRKLLRSDEFAGFTSCRPCHEKQSDFWESTAHSHAYKTLADEGQSFNLACLSCHVTGGNITDQSPEEDKVLLLAVSKEQRSVSCEVCHGPAKKHAANPEEVLPIRAPAEKLCRSCHTKERDGNFTMKEKLPRISCPASLGFL